MEPVEPDGDGCRVHLQVTPRASKTRVLGLHSARVKVAVAAPPTDGKANAALVKFLSKTLGVRRDAIQLVSGDTGRRKTIAIAGLSAAAAAAALGVADAVSA